MRKLAALAAAGAVFAGCGGGGDSAQELLRETAANLDRIESGDLVFRLLVDPRGEGREFGFEIHGAFALRSSPLPLADVQYTQIASGQRATVTVVSTGKRAYVEAGGKAYELPPELAAQLRVVTGGAAGDGLGELRVERWIREPERDGEGEVGGEETDRVRGELALVEVANGLSELAGQAGGASLRRLEGASAEQLDRAVRQSRFELETGKDDRLLRRLLMEADVAFDVPRELRAALGELVGAKITFELTIANPNKEVRVEAPADPRPYSELVPNR